MTATPRKLLRLLCACLCLLCCLSLLGGCGGDAADESSASRNAVTSVTVGRGSEGGDGSDATLTVTATLTDSVVKSLKENGKICLFEQPARFGSTVDLRGMAPVAAAQAASSLRFSLNLYDGARSRLFSSFLLASYDETARQYTVLTSPVAVSNPEALADTAPRAEAEVSVKGLSTAHPADAVRLGASSTVVDVSMGDIIRGGWSEDAVSFLCNGVTYYYNGAAVRALDGTVSAYTASGIRVYLRFLLESPGEDTPACLYVPGVGTASGYSPNMTDPEAAQLLEAFFRFMAERYASGSDAPGHGLCTSFILGRGVNSASENAADGSVSSVPDTHVSRYEQLVRLAHTALRAETPDGQVYIALDSHLNGNGTADGCFGAQSYLAAFRSEAALRGDFDWQVACELTASSPRVWIPSDSDGDRLTVSSLYSLTDLLSAETYRTSDGNLRQLVITDYAIPSVFTEEVSGTEAEQAETYRAASYAYAYLTAAANPRVEALIYDGTADGAGLYGKDADGNTYRRPIGDTFAAIDTDGADAVLASARAVAGTAVTRAENSCAGLDRPTRTVTGTANVLSAEQTPSARAGTRLIGFDTQSGAPSDGFSAVEGVVYLDAAPVSDSPALHASLNLSADGTPAGITGVLPASDLTAGRTLLLDMQTSAGGENGTGNLTATVLLTRVSKGAVADGDGTLRLTASASVTAGSRLTLQCDMAEFAAMTDPGDTVLLTVLIESGTPAACDLYLHEVRLVTAKSGSAHVAVLVAVLAAAAVLLVAGTVAFLYVRSRRNGRFSR
jgi:hypothetical protein